MSNVVYLSERRRDMTATATDLAPRFVAHKATLLAETPREIERGLAEMNAALESEKARTLAWLHTVWWKTYVDK